MKGDHWDLVRVDTVEEDPVAAGREDRVQVAHKVLRVALRTTKQRSVTPPEPANGGLNEERACLFVGEEDVVGVPRVRGRRSGREAVAQPLQVPRELLEGRPLRGLVGPAFDDGRPQLPRAARLQGYMRLES